MSDKRSVAIIGGGPAGLRAAEVAGQAGAKVTLYDQMPSVGRKLLVAGKSGLNLTNDAPFEMFLEKYSGENLPRDLWKSYLRAFDPCKVRSWAEGLGVETFVAGGGKVFPVSKKAAPLLRRWVQQLKASGVDFMVNHSWVGLRQHAQGLLLKFNTKSGPTQCIYDAVVLACGGASWVKTGSDGRWVEVLRALDLPISDLRSANCGWECQWTDETRNLAEGQPLHHLGIRAGRRTISGELMVTRYGFEGSPMYHLGPELRMMEQPEIFIDFKPMFTLEHMVKKMESARRDFYKEARLRWKFTEATCAILRQLYGDFESAEALAQVAKNCRIQLLGPRPLDEAISTAGGVQWSGLDDSLMVKAMPGVYCAGEMIDWEAPTGGFLLQGCFITGSVAGRAAAG